MNMTLPTEPAERKATPIWRGCVMFFAAALAGVARISHQFNASNKLSHDRKTTDHMDCAMRHAMDAEDLAAAYERTPPPCAMEGGECKRRILDEVDQATWRVLAWSQAMHEKYGGAPLAPGAVQSRVGGVERGPQSVPLEPPLGGRVPR